MDRKKEIEKGCGVAGCGCVLMVAGIALPLILVFIALLAGAGI